MRQLTTQLALIAADQKATMCGAVGGWNPATIAINQKYSALAASP